MYVPALNGRKSCELGNIHFQHPLRSSINFNEKLDRFSAIVIYLALISLAADPGLWQRFQSGGEGLLFQRADFLDPSNSRLLRTLGNLPGISRYITIFKQICLSPMEAIPSLEELITGNVSQPLPMPDLLPVPAKKVVNIPVFHSDWMPSILNSIGQIVTVTGEVKEIFHGHTEEGADHIFLNFGNWKDNCFTTVIWGSVLEDVLKTQVDLDTWMGRTISVTGLMSIRNKRPQILVEAVTDLVPQEHPQKAQKAISNNPTNKPTVKAAKEIFSHDSQIVVPTPSISQNPKIILDNLFNVGKNSDMESVLNQLYSSDRFKKQKNKKK
jgi:DNA/RNA endonuclease YhcR with UshA esterase domain